MNEITWLYLEVRKRLLTYGYAPEIAHVEQLRFETQTAASFLMTYIYVVLNTAMRNQVAEQMMERFVASGYDPATIHHQGKQKAICAALAHYEDWFEALQMATDKTAFLGTLPFLGPVTKYHMARNLGIDAAKPDRHLARLAAKYQFTSVQDMCSRVAAETGHRIGVVDVVLWRACNIGLIDSRAV